MTITAAHVPAIVALIAGVFILIMRSAKIVERLACYTRATPINSPAT